MSKLKINIFASYISQIYIIVISLLILPLYMKYMGAEAYGLVGFFTMLQGLFMLVDFGLTPTISRQTAQYNAGVETALVFRQLFRALSLIFTAIAIIGAGLLWYLDTYIAVFWLKLQHLHIKDVLFALQVMAICVALRWMTGLYRGVISGFEKIMWLSGINTLVATLRFLGVLIYMYCFGFNVNNFTGECWISTEKIADYFKNDPRTVKKWFKELETLGLIVRIQNGYKRVANTFLLPYGNEKI